MYKRTYSEILWLSDFFMQCQALHGCNISQEENVREIYVDVREINQEHRQE